MDKNRRHFLITGAALIAGCQSAARMTHVPGVNWPAAGGRPVPDAEGYVPEGPSPHPTPAATRLPIQVIPRSAWTHTPPTRYNINAMAGIGHITVHHEGMPDPIRFTARGLTAEHLDMVRRSHRNRGWADIGYHFIIDRAGRAWEGRPLRYQGAHVKDHNEHNIGVMVLGNFDIQQPTHAQLTTLRDTVRGLRRHFHVSQGAIHTHQELRPTACPGQSLQPRVEAMRQNGMFA